ncbi:MAG: hypothetical protein OET18_15390, partial [Desulfobacterales bacterium]|nr:hypothetical protein [Desulfobacterales bacterium]
QSFLPFIPIGLRLGERRYAKFMPMKSFLDNRVREAMSAGWPTVSSKLWFFFLTHMGASL